MRSRIPLLVRSLPAVLAAAMALALPAAGGGPVTITFWHGMSGVLQPAVNELTEDFNKLNPGIVVNAQYQGTYGALNQKLIAAVAAGNPPTITQLFPNWTDQLIRARAIVPMDRFIKGPGGLSEEELNDILPILRQANTFDGVMWTMPFNKSLYLLFYNVDLLKQSNADFGAGKVAMYIATNPGLAFAKAAVAGKFEIGLAPLPYKRSRATLLSGTDVAITAKASPEQQAAAWRYIKFITGTTGTTRWSLRTFYMPVRRSARDSTLMRVYLRDNPEHRAGLDSLAFAKAEPSISEWQEIRDIISDAAEQALLGKMTPKQALDEAAAKANRLLAQRK